MYILGVRIDNFSRKEILEKVERFLDEPSFHQIATINPEFLLQAQKNHDFKNILNSCDLNVADGVGIWYAYLRHFRFLKTRIAGADLMHEILEIADKKNLRVFLAISKNSLSAFEEIKKSLQKKYPNILIYGVTLSCHSGLDPESRASQDEIQILKQVQDDSVGAEYNFLEKTICDVMLCNFGAPMQEKFLNIQKSGNIRLAMGVGGSFDFLTGKVKRAPKFMRFVGLEWLFRLCLEPKYRFKRIFNAVIVFPYKIIFSKKHYD